MDKFELKKIGIEYNTCLYCKHESKATSQNPCNTCLRWEDGFLYAANYHPDMIIQDFRINKVKICKQ
jgi:hypothetical protein